MTPVVRRRLLRGESMPPGESTLVVIWPLTLLRLPAPLALGAGWVVLLINK